MDISRVSGAYTTLHSGELFIYDAHCWREGLELVWKASVWRDGTQKGETGSRFDDLHLRDPSLYVRLAIESDIERRISVGRQAEHDPHVRSGLSPAPVRDEP